MAQPRTDIDGYEERFWKLLPRSHDTTLLVLKGHLLMEELVNELIASQLPNPAAFPPTQISLHHRICLARAMLPGGALDSVLDAALKLNTLRNKLAHHLDHPQVDQLMADFLRSLEDPETPAAEFKAKTSTRLRRCISFLCGTLLGMITGIRVVKRRGAIA